MDQGLKERLVGAAVLVAIAVWLIPWVLDGPERGIETQSNSLQLPSAEEPMPMRTQTLRLGDALEPPAEIAAAPPPESKTPAVEPAPRAAEPPAQTAAVAEPAAVSAPEPEPEPEPAVVAAAPPPERPAPAAAPPPAPARPAPAAATAAAGDWTVQLGSFGEEANARRLAQRADTFGYKAEVSSYRSDGRTLYRVRVGPQATRAAADAAASALRAHGIDARVVAAR
jgi:DedD protein